MEQNKQYSFLYKIFLLFSFVLIMVVIFILTFAIFGINFLKFADSFSLILIKKLDLLNENPIVFSLFKNVFIIGFGTVLSLLPIISLYYFFMAILEESFYLKKVLFIFEKPLNKICLTSSNIMPLLTSFGCCVNALQSLNKVESVRERKISALAISFLTCAGKIPLCIALAMVYFPKFQWLVAFGFYCLGISISFLLILLATPRLNNISIKEKPILQIPNLKIIINLVVNKVKTLLFKVYPVFFICILLVWFLFTFDFNFNYATDVINSIGGCLGRFFSHIFSPWKIYDWRVSSSFLSGILFKENLVNNLSILTNGVENFHCVLPRISIGVFATFCLISTPCVCVVSELKRQFSAKFATFVVFFQYLIAWLLASALFSFGVLIWKLYLFKAHNILKVV